MQDNCPLPSTQSAYREAHSTETALVKICSDILDSMDQQQVVLLVLLDLSAAFDTIDIVLLLETMQKDLGLSGQTIKWYSSYMSKCTQQIKVNNILSKPFSLEYSVPQGSCNGPVLFSIYCQNLMQIVQQHLPNVRW